MKGAGPGQAKMGKRGAFVGRRRTDDPLRPPRHLQRRAAREGQEENSFCIDSIQNQMGDAMRERIGLARPRAGDDQQRRGLERTASGALARRRRLPLPRIQPLKLL